METNKTNTLTLRERLAAVMTSPFTVITATSVIFTLSVITSNYGTILGFVIALFTLWAIKWKWSYFGFQRNPFFKTLGKAVIYTGIIILVNDFLFQPVIELYYGSTDLSSFEGIKGNVANYVIFILIMWVVAAFGEEFLFRGYMIKRLAIIFGESKKAWFAAIIVSSVVFGFAHTYQGVSGIVSTFFVALIFGFILYKNPKNLWAGVLTHGIYDMFGIAMIFLDKERVITNWVLENLLTFL
ncbi:CPBP family intramembrane glutamic endopeptidase [Draconibacterium mangrovi]|uniref:CPBP family intramembrane glutamic endopeptidase n=1 Tax=Draconibacterium mangrovi TaxID=2697469 RepID=UPI0013D64B30|nr:CPBP family intramembrane glutamic endopeptidase [Draconibacterium mangrovi]